MINLTKFNPTRALWNFNTYQTSKVSKQGIDKVHSEKPFKINKKSSSYGIFFYGCLPIYSSAC